MVAFSVWCVVWRGKGGKLGLGALGAAYTHARVWWLGGWLWCGGGVKGTCVTGGCTGGALARPASGLDSRLLSTRCSSRRIVVTCGVYAVYR